MLIRLLLATAVLGYTVAWLSQLVGFRAGRDTERLRSVFWAAGASVLHAVALVAAWVTFRAPPLVGFGPAAATLALALVTGFFLASRNSERWSAGLLVLPLVVGLLAASVGTGLSPAEPAIALRGPWLVGHVLAVLGGYASLLLASVAAVMYLLQFRALKQKEFGNVFRFFPSLESLDRMNRIGLAVGLPILALGILAGWSLTLTFERAFSLTERDVAFGLLTWAAYAAALAARGRPERFGPGTAIVSVVAFLASGAAFLVFRTWGGATASFL